MRSEERRVREGDCRVSRYQHVMLSERLTDARLRSLYLNIALPLTGLTDDLDPQDLLWCKMDDCCDSTDE